MQESKVAPTRSRSVSAGALIATRVLAGTLAVLVIVQGALAGSHLTGDGAALEMHRMLGTVVLTSRTSSPMSCGARCEWWPAGTLCWPRQ